MIFRFVLFISLCVQVYAKQENIHFCVTKKDAQTTITCDETYIYTHETTIDKAIKEMQERIRYIILDAQKAKKQFRVVLYARGFEGTLLAIAQTNLLRYYREYIGGIILEDVPSSIDTLCDFNLKTTSSSKVCKKIKSFNTTLKEKASLEEVSHALSPALQMDWYWPTVLLISHSGGVQYRKWIEAFEQNEINYFESQNSRKEVDYLKTLVRFYETIDQKSIKVKNGQKPNYHGPLLRFHLSKILYAPMKKVFSTKDVQYGKSKQQAFDVYMDNNHSEHPLLVYVHGGGWTKGDKSSFKDFCKQYANRGYTAIALNYRLLNLPSVGMKEMVADVKSGLEQILHNRIEYHAKDKPVVLMGESAGAQLLFMALSKMQNTKINAVVLNSITADLHKHSEKKQQRLSGIKEKKEREVWLNRYSPLSNLYNYKTPTLAIHSLDDSVVPASHLKALDLQSVIHHQNIQTLWVTGAEHPIVPYHHSMQPGYADIEKSIDKYLYKHFK